MLAISGTGLRTVAQRAMVATGVPPPAVPAGCWRFSPGASGVVGRCV